MKPIRCKGRAVFGKVRTKTEAIRPPAGLDTVQTAMWNLSTFSQQVTALIEDAEKFLFICATTPQNDDEESAAQHDDSEGSSLEKLKIVQG